MYKKKFTFGCFFIAIDESTGSCDISQLLIFEF